MSGIESDKSNSSSDATNAIPIKNNDDDNATNNQSQKEQQSSSKSSNAPTTSDPDNNKDKSNQPSKNTIAAPEDAITKKSSIPKSNKTSGNHNNNDNPVVNETNPAKSKNNHGVNNSNHHHHHHEGNNNNKISNYSTSTNMEEEEEEDSNLDTKDTLLTMAFNQDGGCLAVGTGNGFRICNVSPFEETFRRQLGGGGEKAGIAHITMLYRTNLLALTGHTSTCISPHYPPNKVFIYDDHSQQKISELSFRQKVLNTKLRRDRIIVVLRDRVYVYDFSDFRFPLDKIATGDNPGGLIGISLDNVGVGGISTGNNGGGGGGCGDKAEDALGNGQRNGMVLACPSTQRGQVRIELYGLRRTTFVDAHESALGALALSVDGSLLATASERGTVIRLFDTRGVTVGGGRGPRDSTSSSTGSGGENATVSSSVPLREFRRGVERATISCLTFSLDSCWLGCASNHGTVHVFQAMDPNNPSNDPSSLKSSSKEKSKPTSMTGKAFRLLPKLVVSPKKYLGMDGEQSYAQVRGIPYPRACAFVPDRDRTIAVAGVDEYGNGCLLLAEFGKSSSSTGAAGASGNINSRQVESSEVDDSEARRLGYYRFFKKGGAAAMHNKSGVRRHHAKSKEGKSELEEGGAYIDDDNPINIGMNDIQIGDENEDEFVPIDYNETKNER